MKQTTFLSLGRKKHVGINPGLICIYLNIYTVCIYLNTIWIHNKHLFDLLNSSIQLNTSLFHLSTLVLKKKLPKLPCGSFPLKKHMWGRRAMMGVLDIIRIIIQIIIRIIIRIIRIKDTEHSHFLSTFKLGINLVMFILQWNAFWAKLFYFCIDISMTNKNI